MIFSLLFVWFNPIVLGEIILSFLRLFWLLSLFILLVKGNLFIYFGFCVSMLTFSSLLSNSVLEGISFIISFLVSISSVGFFLISVLFISVLIFWFIFCLGEIILFELTVSFDFWYWLFV